MKTILSLFLISLFIFSAVGQEMKVRFGKISPEDLAMTIYPQDSDAVAVVLSKVGRIRFDVLQENFPLTEQHHVVIKIL